MALPAPKLPLHGMRSVEAPGSAAEARAVSAGCQFRCCVFGMEDFEPIDTSHSQRGVAGVSPQKGSVETPGSAAGEGFPLTEHSRPNSSSAYLLSFGGPDS